MLKYLILAASVILLSSCSTKVLVKDCEELHNSEYLLCELAD